jgi:hypothetical protein
VHRGWIAACIILCWPLAIAAVLAANRAARALGAGDHFTAYRDARQARSRAQTGTIVGGTLVAFLLATNGVVGVVAAGSMPELLAEQGIDLSAAEQAPDAYRTAAAPKREPITLSPLELRTGDCFLAPDWEKAWEDIDVIPCSRLHDSQVIATTEHRQVEYPGADVVSENTWSDCAPRYTLYTGMTASADSPVGTFDPTWDDWGDNRRTSVCFVQVPEPVRGELSGYPQFFGTGANA